MGTCKLNHRAFEAGGFFVCPCHCSAGIGHCSAGIRRRFAGIGCAE
jgi:hypothetical protein